MDNERDRVRRRADGIWLSPIHGLKYEGNLDQVILELPDDEGKAHEFRIVSIPSKFKTDLESVLRYHRLSVHDVQALSVGIRCNTPAVFGEEPIRTVGLRLLSFALSLRYYGISLSDSFLIEGGLIGQGGVQSTGHEWLIHRMPSVQPLMVNDLPHVTYFASAAAQAHDRVAMSLVRYYEGSKRAAYADAFVDFVIALDGLLSAYDRNKFVQRAHELLKGDYTSPMFRSQLEAVYTLRSHLVHGNASQATRILTSAFDGRIEIASGFTRTLAATAFQKMLIKPELLDPKRWR